MMNHEDKTFAVGMTVLVFMVVALCAFIVSGCASGSQTVQGPDGWKWNSSWSALGGASIQKAAQQFDGELVAEQDSLSINLESGQQVEGAVSPEIKAEIAKAFTTFLQFMAAP